jgi:tRNA G10  N-methylase Trm11
MYIAILGRQPELGIAELERIYGANNLEAVSTQTVSIKTDVFDIQRFGGVPKAGKIIDQISAKNWPEAQSKIINHYLEKWSSFGGKITIGISAYDININPREIQKIGIVLKQKLKKSGISMRLVPNDDLALNTATSHHNKLGLSNNKVELLIIAADNGKIILAESSGAQNITAYANRDQKRPRRDAFVGMLPPKLAQIMINLTGIKDPAGRTLLDPFCGTGTLLQEALLLGYSVYGTDLSEKMVSYSHDNLKWLSQTFHRDFSIKLGASDATSAKWAKPIDTVVCESYLGQPFSAPPSPAKLTEVAGNCNHIISEFLINLRDQIQPDTPVCIAVPAWRSKNGDITHLPLIETVGRLGYKPYEFQHVSKNDMIYYRENQVVAREILVLTKI